MDAAELAEWVAFAALEPFGSRVEDVRAGTLASAMVAPYGGKTRPGDWFRWEPPRPSGDWRTGHAAFGASAVRVRRADTGAGD
jgi:hypothetical protein